MPTLFCIYEKLLPVFAFLAECDIKLNFHKFYVISPLEPVYVKLRKDKRYYKVIWLTRKCFFMSDCFDLKYNDTSNDTIMYEFKEVHFEDKTF